MKMLLFYITIVVGFVIKVEAHHSHSNLHYKILNISNIVRGKNVFELESCSVIFFGYELYHH